MRVLLDQLPELLVEWRTLPGPAILLQAYRWIVDSRDEDTGARTDDWKTRSSCTAATPS